jgi:HlyD family secretion protein
MSATSRTGNLALWLLTGLLVVAVGGGVGVYLISTSFSAVADGGEPRGGGGADSRAALVTFQVVRPQVGGMEHTADQPGTVQAFESAQLYSEVPGFLKTQTVDIGDRVTKGQVLAEIAVPELAKQVQRHKAAVDQAKANVKVMQAREDSARADLEVAESGVVKADATAKSAKAMRSFREKQFHRMQELHAKRDIDERLLDESQEQAEAAIEAERAARAAIVSANAQVTAQKAKIRQAEADVLDAEAAVEVAQAELEQADVMVKFATITSPYDGVVTQRNFFPGDFIRAATAGSQQLPLLTVERTDKMRIVIQIPDRDVPYTNPGAPAFVEIDALPETHVNKLQGRVARIAGAEDQQTKLMRAEIDVPNPSGRLRQGMYGKAKIVLESPPGLLSLPTSCLVGKPDRGKATVFVVRDGHARRVPVEVGADNGVRVGILSGLKADDDVVLNPTALLLDNAPVAAVSSDAKPEESR